MPFPVVFVILPLNLPYRICFTVKFVTYIYKFVTLSIRHLARSRTTFVAPPTPVAIATYMVIRFVLPFYLHRKSHVRCFIPFQFCRLLFVKLPNWVLPLLISHLPSAHSQFSSYRHRIVSRSSIAPEAFQFPSVICSQCLADVHVTFQLSVPITVIGPGFRFSRSQYLAIWNLLIYNYT